jgi:hypothetical protein
MQELRRKPISSASESRLWAEILPSRTRGIKLLVELIDDFDINNIILSFAVFLYQRLFSLQDGWFPHFCPLSCLNPTGHYCPQSQSFPAQSSY